MLTKDVEEMERVKPYGLYYWPGIQGRGEFIRLALEYAGVKYVDVARQKNKKAGQMFAAYLSSHSVANPPFAPPFLEVGDSIIGQTAAILLFLGDRHGLAPRNKMKRLWTHQIQLTIGDCVNEVHDTHHPISASLYYEDQKLHAKRRAKIFREERMPKFLSWFEQILQQNLPRDPRLVGRSITYADLSLFQLVEGLRYAFPRAMQNAPNSYPRLCALHQFVAQLPRIKAYCASDRRIPFNEDGIFRHYPELDG
jgi:glutathione S-transferase